MPVNIGKLTSEVTAFDGSELPLSPQQIEQLVQLVLERLEQHQRNDKLNQQMMSLPARPDKLPWHS